MKQYQENPRKRDNKIKYFDELLNIEKMMEFRTIRQIYDYMKELVQYTHEDELNYIQIPRVIERYFEDGKTEFNINESLVPDYIKLTLKRVYDKDITYRSGFCMIYGMLSSFYNKDIINKKINKDYRYTRDFVQF